MAEVTNQGYASIYFLGNIYYLNRVYKAGFVAGNYIAAQLQALGNRLALAFLQEFSLLPNARYFSAKLNSPEGLHYPGPSLNSPKLDLGFVQRFGQWAR